MSGEAIALVCANFGGIDGMKPVDVKDPRVVSFYYTDEATASLASARAREGWDHIIVPNYPRHDFSPRLRARYFKHQIHRLDEVQGFRWLMWVDASVWLRDPSFIPAWADILDGIQDPASHCMVVPHGVRSTVQEEFDYIQGQVDAGPGYMATRYKDEKMKEQMAWFKKNGMNTDAQFFIGTLWMVENSPLMNEAWNTWWDQNLRFGMMDQLSFPLVLEHYGINPVRFSAPRVGELATHWVVSSHKVDM